MNDNDKKYLLNLARQAIKAELESRNFKANASGIPVALKQAGGTFVTLEIGGKLRGCIGHITPVQDVYKDVIENACAAAFSDPRFDPLSKEEFEKIDIEISLLSPTTRLVYQSFPELIKTLEQNKPGVILKKVGRVATFLPQVWQELPSAEAFLSQLCLKAGLSSNAWTENVEFETYSVEKIKEAK